MISKARRELRKDFFLIITGVALAIFLSRIGFIAWFINVLGEPAIASFVAGIFFTSVFTVAPAAVALANIEAVNTTVAVFGALGAMFGDLVLFYFIKDRFANDLLNSLKPSLVKHFLKSFHLGFLKWLSPILGALIIASPLPDELGLTLLGLSKTRLAILMPVSYAMNLLGIILILWFNKLF